MERGQPVVLRVPRWVERSEEEQVVLQTGNVATDFGGNVIPTHVQQLSLKVEAVRIVHLLAFCFEALRSEEGRYATMELIAARLGHDLDQAAGALAVLRLVAARLDLHF